MRPSADRAPEAPVAAPAVMRSLALLPFYPPVLVGALTLLPLLFMEGRLPGTMGLAYAQGREPALYFYGVACVLAFALTFRLAFRPRDDRTPRALSEADDAGMGWPLVLAVLGLVGVGLGVVYLTVRGATAERLVLVLAAGQSDPALREEVIGSESVPGVVRMLNYLVPAALVLSLAAWLARVRLSAVQRLGMFGVSLGALGVRSIVFMDRQPIFTAALLICAAGLERVRWTTARAVAAATTAATLAAGLLSLASVLARIRGGEQVEQNTILHYADLGVANSILAMRTATDYSLGANSVWSALTFVPRGIGLGNLPLPSSDAEWVWNPAANMLCHSYQDFGPFGVITYVLLGTVAGSVCRRRAAEPRSVLWAAGYLWCVLALLGIWTVPLTRGTEFWCAVLATSAVGFTLDRWRWRRPGGWLVTAPPPSEWRGAPPQSALLP
jgi:hypothetical protein